MVEIKEILNVEKEERVGQSLALYKNPPVLHRGIVNVGYVSVWEK